MGYIIDSLSKPASSGGTTPRTVGSLGGSSALPSSGGSSSFGRIDLSGAAVAGIGMAASAPGYIYDRPLAALNTIGKNSPTDKGLIDQAGDTIRSIPIAGPLLGGAADVAGGALNTVSGLPFAATNAWVATALSDNYGKSDSDQVEGIAGGIMTFKNVGEMRQYFADRGWTPEDVADLRAGKKGAFDFQDKSISTNPALDLTGRMVLDPTNLLAVGALGAVAKGAIKAATLGGRVAEGTTMLSRIDKLATGTKALDDAIGLSRAGYKGTLAGMAALRAGEVTGVTLGTLGRHMAMLSRGSSDFLRAYRKVAITTTGAQLGLQEMAKAGVLDNTPLSPIMETLYEAANRMAEDKPLSSGQLFNLWAAVNFPLRSSITDGLSSTRKNGLGIGVGPATFRITPFFKRVSDIESRVVEALAPGMSFKEGRAHLIELHGDEQVYLDRIAHAARSVVAETGTFTALMNQPTTTAGFLAMGEMNNRALELATRARIENGLLSGKDVVEKMRESFTGERSTRRDKTTGSVQEVTGRVHREWDPDASTREWVEWSREMRNANLANGATKGTNVVIGVMDGVLPKEHLTLAKALLKDIAGSDGTIPKNRMDEFLELFPALSADLNDPGNFFARLRAPDSGEVNVNAAIQRVDRLLGADPITMREYLYGQEQLEARAEKLAQNKGTVRNERGMPDVTLSPDLGEAGVLTPTLSNAVRRKTGVAGLELEDVLASRPGARAVEGDVAAVLDESGWNVRNAVQGIVSEDGKMHTAIFATLDSATDPGSLELAAAASLKRTKSNASVAYYSGAEALTRHGLTMNAQHVRFDIGNMSDAEKKALLRAVTDAFDGQYKMNDTAGVLHVFAKQGQEDAWQDLADVIEGIVGRDRMGLTRQPAWVQTVYNDMKGGKRGRVPDGAVSARGIFDAARGDLRLVNADRKFSERLVRVTEFDTATSAKAVDARGDLGNARAGVTRGPESARAGSGVLGDDGRGVVAGGAAGAYSEGMQDLASQVSTLTSRLDALSTTVEKLQKKRNKTNRDVMDLDAASDQYRAAYDELLGLERKTNGVAERGTDADRAAYREAFPDDLGYAVGGYKGRYMSDMMDVGGPLPATDAEDIAYRVKAGRKALQANSGGVLLKRDREELAQRAAFLDQLEASAAAQTNVAGPTPGVPEWQTMQRAINASGVGTWNGITATLRDGSDVFLSPSPFIGTAADNAVMLADGNFADAAIIDRISGPSGQAIWERQPASASQPPPQPAPAPSPYVATVDSTLPNGEVIQLTDRDMAYDAMTPSLKGDKSGEAPLGGIDPEQLQKVSNTELELRQYDPQYRLKLAPKKGNVGTYYAGQGDSIRDLMLASQAAGDLWYHKALKPAARLWDAMLDPVKTSRLARESKQAFYREMLAMTADLPDDKTIRIKDLDSFLQTAHSLAQSTKLGSVQLYTRGELLPPGTLADIATGAYAKRVTNGQGGGIFTGFSPEALEAIGGAENIHKILDRAGSRFYRNIRDIALSGGKKGELGRLIDGTYGPVRAKTAKGRNYLRTWYHAFRFTLDPRFHIMNHVEADLLGLGRDGWSATRLGGARSEAALTDKAMLLHTRGESGLERQLDAVASGFLDTRHIEGYIANSFDVRRENSTREVLRSLAENDPAMIAMRKKFGGTVDEMVDGLEQSMYNIDMKGTEQAFLDEAFQGILDEAERKAMEPLLVRLYEQNTRIVDNVKAMYHGNTNRSNLERTLNSYFLYWPISYQLKATKWLFDVLTKESLGRKTNLGGAWYMNHLYEQHVSRLAEDESYQRMFIDNPDMWFLASMLLPMTPFDMGVGFSRTSRYILSSAALATGNQEFAQTVGGETFAKNPGDAAILIFRMGPAYSIELARSILRQMGDKNRDLVVPVN